MIYDCFTFNNELDLLEIRLNVLEGTVDRFVLVEADRTHRGDPKPLLFEANKARFERFLGRIEHVKVTDFPDLDGSPAGMFGNRWILENFQRDAILRGLGRCLPDDIVLVSDVDEIPNPTAIRTYTSGIGAFEMKSMWYFLNNQSVKEPLWSKARICRFSDLLDPGQNLRIHDSYRFSGKGKPTYLRFCKGKRIRDGGWHFSYCGGVDAIVAKRKSVVELQFQTEENMRREKVLEAVMAGTDVLGRKGFTYRPIPLDDTFPAYILDHREEYAHLVCPAPAAIRRPGLLGRLRSRFSPA